LAQIFVQSTDKSPVFVELLFAKSNGINWDVAFALNQGILYQFQIEHVFIVILRSPDDSIDEYDSWEIVVKDSAINYALSKLFYFERRRDIR